MIRPAVDYRAVAQLHIDSIDQGFLSQLGIGFLTLLYEAIDADANSILLTASDGHRIVGFISAAGSMGPIYRQMLRRWPRLTLALAPSLTRPRRLVRILEILRYSARTRPSLHLPDTELLSLAVAADSRGRGHADRLYADLVQSLKARQVEAFKIIVGAPLEAAHAFYRRMGARQVGWTEVHKGQASTVYVQRVRCRPRTRVELSDFECPPGEQV